MPQSSVKEGWPLYAVTLNGCHPPAAADILTITLEFGFARFVCDMLPTRKQKSHAYAITRYTHGNLCIPVGMQSATYIRLLDKSWSKPALPAKNHVCQLCFEEPRHGSGSVTKVSLLPQELVLLSSPPARIVNFKLQTVNSLCTKNKLLTEALLERARRAWAAQLFLQKVFERKLPPDLVQVILDAVHPELDYETIDMQDEQVLPSLLLSSSLACMHLALHTFLLSSHCFSHYMRAFALTHLSSLLSKWGSSLYICLPAGRPR